MKKIYLFLALAIAVAINANAKYYLNTWEKNNGNSELHNACNNSRNWAFSEDGTYTFSEPLTVTAVEGFTIKDGTNEYLTTAITPSNSWKNVKVKVEDDPNYKNYFKLVPGTYTKVTFDGSTLTFEGTPSQSISFTLGTWNCGDNVLNNLAKRDFTRNSDNTQVLVFDSPITLVKAEQFKLRYGDEWYGDWGTDDTNEWNWIGSGNNGQLGDVINLAPGTYYSATIDECTTEGVKMRFNTYAETTTGLDAVVNSAADYVKVKATLYGHYFDGTYLFASTTENNSSKKNTINEGDKGLGYSDDESKFTQNDWVAIEGLTSDFVGKEIAGGNIVELKANAAYPVVKLVSTVEPANGTTLVANTYRVANFNIGKDVNAVKYVWLVAPQAGEYCHVRGYVAAAADGKVTLKSAKESSTATIGETQITVDPVEMTVNYSGAVTPGNWFSFTGIVVKNGDALELNALSAEDVSTGVESVETANATVFAANGTINVSSEAQAAIEVYTANGQMVSAINADNASIAVAPGFYLVKVGNQVSKVVVK